MNKIIFTFLASFVSFCGFAKTNFYISTSGNNTNNGSLEAHWQTIQHGVSQLSSGDTLNIMSGTYDGKIELNVSGTMGAEITIRNYNSDTVVVNGVALSDYEYLLKIENVNYINIIGLKFQDYQKLDAQGIVLINSSNVRILNNEFSNIDYSSNAEGETPNSSQNSQPIIVFGRDSLNPIVNLAINGNTIKNCETGWSECLSINGNIDGFEIKNNHVFNNTNIPIVAIGHEGECPNPSLDQARNGLIKNNNIHDNPSSYAAAGGIYIDGGKSITIENNRSYNNDYGIEIGCENNGNAPNDPSSSNIVVRNNLIYNNTITGIALGGYDYPSSGKVETTSITNNTLFSNDTENSYNGEMFISYVENSTIENNIFYANNTDNVLLISENTSSSLSLNYNQYYTASGTNELAIEINGMYYGEFSTYQMQTDQDSNSTFDDPLFNNITTSDLDLHLTQASPSIDAGNPMFVILDDEKDMDGDVRVYNGNVDIGADEYGSCTQLDSCGLCEGDDSVCPSTGCTYPGADNFDPINTIDNGSCLFSGCTNPESENYVAFANNDDGSCLDDPCLGNDCPFDTNLDGEIGSADLLIFLIAYGANCGEL